MYVNGVRDDLNSNNYDLFGTAQLPFTGNIWFIGQTPFWPNNMDGTIDEFRIYARALSATEILNLYNLTVPSHANTSSANLTDGSGSTLTNGLVGLWTFDGADMAPTVADRSGNGNNGSFQGAATSSAVTIGKLGQAVNFHSNNAVIMTPTASEDNLDLTGSLSMSFWLYIAAEPPTNGDGIVVSKQVDFPSVGKVTFSVNLDSTNNLGNGVDHLYLWWSCSASCANPYSGYVSNVTYKLGEWDDWVIIRNNTAQTVTMYRNGVNIGATDSPGNGFQLPVDSTNSGSGNAEVVEIGNNLNDGNAPFVGKIDDLRIYNRAISASEAKALYNLGSAKINTSATTLTNGSTLTSGLMGHWTFDGSTVTDKIYDSSGQGNNGYLYNAATSSAKVIGKLGQAFQLTGNSDYVGISPNSLDLSGTESVSFWLYMNSDSGGSNGPYILAQRNTGTDHDSFSAEADPLGDCAEVDRMQIWWTNGGAAFVGYLSDAAHPYRIGNWDHWVIIRDNVNQIVKMYRNGQDAGAALQCDVSTFKTPDSSTNNVTIGGANFRTTDGVPGKIDDVRIYNRVLSASEVNQLYLIGK